MANTPQPDPNEPRRAQTGVEDRPNAGDGQERPESEEIEQDEELDQERPQ